MMMLGMQMGNSLVNLNFWRLNWSLEALNPRLFPAFRLVGRGFGLSKCFLGIGANRSHWESCARHILKVDVVQRCLETSTAWIDDSYTFATCICMESIVVVNDACLVMGVAFRKANFFIGVLALVMQPHYSCST